MHAADAGRRGAIHRTSSPCDSGAATVSTTAWRLRGGCRRQPISGDGSIFAGILHGLDNQLPLQEEVEGNGLEQESS
ncbi:hypothetical protein ACNKHS_07700 [Shigella flexneri]